MFEKRFLVFLFAMTLTYTYSLVNFAYFTEAGFTNVTSDGLENKTLYFSTSREVQFSISLPHDAFVKEARMTFQGLDSYKNYSLLHTTQNDFYANMNKSSEIYILNSLLVRTSSRESSKAGAQFLSDKLTNLTLNNTYTPAALELSKCTSPVYLLSKNVAGGINKNDVSIVVDDNGIVHLVWTGKSGSDTNIYYTQSYDGGKSFLPPTKINSGSDSANQSQACIAVSQDGVVHIAWKDERNGLGQIYYACSGSAFTNVKVDTSVLPNVDQSEPAIAVGPDGLANIVWEEAIFEGSLTYRLCYAKALSEYAFTPPYQIGSGTNYKGEATIAVDLQNRAHIAYSDDPGIRTIMYTNTTNGTFTNYIRVSTEGAYQYWPSIAVDSNYDVHLAWQDTTDFYAQAYYSHLEAGANSFDSRVSISEGSNWEIAPKIYVGNDGKIWVAWTDFNGEFFDIYVCNSTNGISFSQRERISDSDEFGKYNRFSVQISVGNDGYPHFCWVDDREGWHGETSVYYTRKLFPVYLPAGYLNATFDLGINPQAWEKFAFNSTLRPYSNVECWARSAEYPTGPWSDWYMIQNNSAPGSLPVRRHLQVKINLTSCGDTTPTLYSVTIRYVSYASEGNYTTFAYHSNRPIVSAGVFYNATLPGQCNVFVSNDYVNWYLCSNGGRVTFPSEGKVYAYRVVIKTDGRTTPEFEDICAYFTSVDYLENLTLKIRDDSNVCWSYAGRFNIVNRTENLASRMNYYLSTHQNLIVNGKIEIPFMITTSKDIDEDNSYAILLFNISIEYNEAPASYEIPNSYHIYEDTCVRHLIDLNEYFLDDYTTLLNYSIVYTNATVVRVSIVDGHYLCVDSENGSANDDWNGVIAVQILAKDDSGLGRVSNIFSIRVLPVNDAPVIRSAPYTNAIAGIPYTYRIDCFDIDGDTLSYYLHECPQGMTLSGNTLSWTPTYSDIGVHNVSISVTDGLETVFQDYQIRVSGLDKKSPKIKPLPEIVTNVTYTLDLEPYMSDEDTPITDLKWSIIEGVNSDFFGPLLDKKNFTLTIVPTNPSQNVGETKLLMQLEDPDGLFDRAELKVIITRLHTKPAEEPQFPIVELALAASAIALIVFVLYYLFAIKGKRTKKEHDEDLGLEEKEENFDLAMF
ncbi:MAG: Ig-like domain-containing protein [Thermoplasmata archaeon]